MPCFGTLMRFVALSVVLVLAGCAEQTGEDLVAPTEAAPLQACTAVPGKRLSAKCADVSSRTIQGPSAVRHV